MKFASILTVLLILIFAAGCGRKPAASGNAATLDELNRAVVAVSMRGGAFPPSTNDVAAFLALTGKTMPVVPPGKRLSSTPKHGGLPFGISEGILMLKPNRSA